MCVLRRKKMKKFNKSEQKGRSMVEMLGVLAIIGVLSVGGISGYSKAMAKFKLTKAQDQLSMMIMNIRTAYATSPGYPGLDNTLAGQYKLVSQEMVVTANGSKLINAFGGSVLIKAIKSADGTDAGAFEIIFNGLGKDACVSLATSDWGTDGLAGIIVAGATKASAASIPTSGIVLPANLPISLVTARTNCSSDNSNSIAWYYM